MEDKRNVQKNFRLSEKEAEALEAILARNNLSLADWIAKNLKENLVGEGFIVEKIDSGTEQILSESEKIKLNQEAFYEDLKKEIVSIAGLVEKTSKSVYRWFADLKLSNESKKNIFNYKQGDLILTDKNNILVVSEVYPSDNEMAVGLFPLTRESTYKRILLEEKHESFISVYR
ncbi:hypothetical protein [Aliarcobacter butzleri]|uniref:hypothetical protein n=1 Tax=Aliarcobacter butzleri TaxID=28197 RepID=UPI0021B22FBA|nr:hypothetical protein [Aliarcobacter butzleri]MCT7596111.1 hypothetical protein [Aliarcobacter butzleri]